MKTNLGFDGKIASYRVYKDRTEIDGRIVFRLTPSLAYKGIKTGRGGCGNEKKFIWQEMLRKMSARYSLLIVSYVPGTVINVFLSGATIL